MSGDHGLRSSIPASLKLLQGNDDLHLHLVGDQSGIEAALGALTNPQSTEISIIHSTDVIPMDADISTVLRSRPVNSSMQMALDTVASGACHAAISGGNTGALMALAMRTLGMQSTYSRPALCAAVPTLAADCHLLDLGANVDCSAELLLEFALMGRNLLKSLHPGREPTVGLLSNGSEPGKGNEQVRRAALLLEEQAEIQFVGNIEADQLQQGVVDVVVCDGFAGNVALKAMEGTGRYLHARLGDMLSGGIDAVINPDHHNGAWLLGLNAAVIKSHGGAGVEGFHSALLQALRSVQGAVVFNSVSE
jgi:glycerol-3-phosphate acyltransferase PlsX